MRLLKLSILTLVVVLAGCASTPVPVVPKFPSAPEILLKKCPNLKTIEGEKVSIIDFTKVVSDNYTLYYECSQLHDSFIDWYNSQKRIFEELK
jgi:hypothetical protein